MHITASIPDNPYASKYSISFDGMSDLQFERLRKFLLSIAEFNLLTEKSVEELKLIKAYKYVESF